MRHMVLSIMFALGTMAAYSTQNDFGAEDDAATKDSYYYTGNEKIPLKYDPTRVAVIDFNERDDIESSKKRVMANYNDFVFKKHYNHDESNPYDFLISIYYTKDNEKHSFDFASDLKVMPCYIYGNYLDVAPSGYIDVRLKKSEDMDILRQYMENYKLIFLGQIQYEPLLYSLCISKETQVSPIEIANTMHETGLFEYASPGLVFNCLEISYDPDVLKQWGLYNKDFNQFDISVSEAWGYSTGRDITIAIIDSAIDTEHEDLKDNISEFRYDAVSDTTPTTFASPEDHGTHCAGIAAAVRNNHLQICGVAPDAKIMPVKVDIHSEKFPNHAARAIKWAYEHGADIISLSWGCPTKTEITNAISDALKYGRNGKGCIIVKSAGDNGRGSGDISFPGNFNHDVITVSAINKAGRKADYSSYGEYVFVCAPGSGILSTVTENKTDYFDGTSMAAPHVAGVAALILSRNPDLTVKQVKEIIAKNTNDISTERRTQKEFGLWDPKFGYGLVDAAKCVKATPRKE